MEARNVKVGKSENDLDGKITVQKCVAALNHCAL